MEHQPNKDDMKKKTSCPTLLAAALISFGIAQANAASTVSLTALTYEQNFDGLANSATASLPVGWGFGSGAGAKFSETATATTQYAGTTGSGALTSSSTGGAYHFYNGVRGTATDQSIGFLTSGSYSSPHSVQFGFTNNTGFTLDGITLSWDYEKYRSGSRAFDWTFYFSLDGETWTAITAGNQSYAADANNTDILNPPTSISKSGIVIGDFLLENGKSFYLRWLYAGSGGSSNAQALGLDNFKATFTAVTPVPEPHEFAIATGGLLLAVVAMRRRRKV